MPPNVFATLKTMGWREGAETPTSFALQEHLLGKINAPIDVPAPRPTDLAAPPPGEDPEDLAIGRWAAVVLEADKDAAAEALKPLIDHRRERGQLRNDDGLVVMRPSATGTVESWTRRFKGAGGDNPPYYLMLVGGPDRFPFEWQFDLDLQRFTGRLDVSDVPNGAFSWEACRRFADKVVAFEKGEVDVEDKVLLYSVTSDDNTRVSHKYLVEKLADTMATAISTLYAGDATVAGLTSTLATPSPPRLVFTASHGVEFPNDPQRWGALTGGGYRGRATDPVLSAELVATSERFAHGSVLFAFACFSAGVPEKSAYGVLTGQDDGLQEFGGAARVAPLPRQLVGHDKGPVAFVGHVDRVTAVAFQSSFGLAGIGPYRHFEGWSRQSGATVARGLASFREQARRAGAQIADAIERATRDGGQPQIEEAVRKWVAFRDYRNFVLIGDPALTYS